MMRTPGERIVHGLCLALFVLTVLVLYAPIVVSAILSIVPQTFGNLQWAQWGPDAYRTLFTDADLMQSMGDSLKVGIAASVISSVVAILLALYLDSNVAIGRKFIEALIYLPFVMPSIITGLSLLLYFSSLSVPLSLMTVTVGHSLFVLAIVYRLVAVRLSNLQASLREASSDLGANRWQTFRHIIFPHLTPAIVAGMLFSTAISIDETLITLFLSGDRMTLPMRLWSMLRIGLSQQIYALVTMVILGTLVLALLGVRSWKRTAVK